jgi:hypothetical protein
MEHLPALWMQLKNVEVVLAICSLKAANAKLTTIEYFVRRRHNILKRIIGIQIREFNRD